MLRLSYRTDSGKKPDELDIKQCTVGQKRGRRFDCDDSPRDYIKM